jgi:splicing factor 1
MVKKRAARMVADYCGVTLPEDEKLKKEKAENGGKRKKRSRWGDVSDVTMNPMLPTVLPANMSKEDEELYMKKLRVEELSQLLRSGYVPEDTRSPSPEPVYNQSGQRLNTKDVRYRIKYEQERHELVQFLLVDNPNYRPPADYKPPDLRCEDRIHIPQVGRARAVYVAARVCGCCPPADQPALIYHLATPTSACPNVS